MDRGAWLVYNQQCCTESDTSEKTQHTRIGISIYKTHYLYNEGFPHSSVSKSSACNAGDLDSIPGSGRSPGEGNGNPLQYSCLENPMDRGAWWAAVYGVPKSRTQLSEFTFTFTLRNEMEFTLWELYDGCYYMRLKAEQSPRGMQITVCLEQKFFNV